MLIITSSSDITITITMTATDSGANASYNQPITSTMTTATATTDTSMNTPSRIIHAANSSGDYYIGSGISIMMYGFFLLPTSSHFCLCLQTIKFVEQVR